MPINRASLKSALSASRLQKCSSTPISAIELDNTLLDTRTVVANCSNAQAVPFILWNDMFNAVGTLSPKKSSNQVRYKWGDKVFVEFGCANIQTEISFPHPAIVLYNFSNTVIVVPTTSDDNPSFQKEIDDVVIKVKSDGNIFPKDTVINLHQIKAVHKDRILNNLKSNVRQYAVDDTEIARLNATSPKPLFSKGMDLLSCIQTRLSMMLSFQQITNLLQEISNLENELKDKDDLLKQKELEIAQLKEEVEKLTAKMDTH